MQAGLLRDRITFTRPLDSSETTQDEFGNDVGSETIGTFYCSVDYLRGGEKQAQQQKWAQARYKIEMRHQPGITFTPKMTATWNGRTLNILEVEDLGNRMRPAITMFAEDFQG